MARYQDNPLNSVLSDLSRRYEPDRFVAALISAPPARGPLLAITAFSAELARIRFEVEEPALMQIRLQWWRDALAEPGRKELAAHPVGKALSAILTELEQQSVTSNLGVLIDETLVAAQLSTGAIGADPLAAAASQNRREDVPLTPAHTVAIEALIFRQSAAVLLPLALPGDAAAVANACTLAGSAYGLARAAFLTTSFAPNNQSVVSKVSRQEVIDQCRRDACLAKCAIAELKRALAPAFHPLALVEPYLRLSEHLTPRRGHALLASLPLRRMWRITQAHWGRKF